MMTDRSTGDKPALERRRPTRLWAVRVAALISSAVFWLAVGSIYLPRSRFAQDYSFGVILVMALLYPPYGFYGLPLFINPDNPKALGVGVGGGLAGLLIPFLLPLQPSIPFLALYGLTQISMIVVVAKLFRSINRQPDGTWLFFRWAVYGALLTLVYLYMFFLLIFYLV